MERCVTFCGWGIETVGLQFTLSRVEIYRVVCERLETTDRIADAIECFHELTCELQQETIGLHDEHLAWALGEQYFRQRASENLERLGDQAIDAQRYDDAIARYSSALSLILSPPQAILIKRSKAWLATEQGDRYINPSSTRAAIRQVVQRTLHRSPRILINTATGRLHDRAERASAFESLPIFKELVSSMTTRIDYVQIKHEVRHYFQYVMLSHKLEDNEPLFQQVVQIAVYDLETSPTHDKLQTFCKIVRNSRFNWTWSDTCCIDKSDHIVLQEALVAMFRWYQGSAMVIKPQGSQHSSLSSIREKLRLASTRRTSWVEDAAYSLLGIFSAIGIPAIYGEGEASLGRLLANVLTRSGDVGILAWTGESSRFNSCMPARITVFNGPVTSHVPPPIPDSEMERIITGLRAPSFYLEVALRLYDRLNELPTPRFAESRMTLPCIAFQIPPLVAYRTGSGRVHRADTIPFGMVEIRTRQDLSRMGPLYLVHPWLDTLMEHEDSRGGTFVEDDALSHSPNLDDEATSDDEIVCEEIDDDSSSLDEPHVPPLPLLMHTTPLDRETGARRLVARLRQSFGALLFTPASMGRRTMDYRRVAADSMITVRFQDNVSLADILNNNPANSFLPRPGHCNCEVPNSRYGSYVPPAADTDGRLSTTYCKASLEPACFLSRFNRLLCHIQYVLHVDDESLTKGSTFQTTENIRRPVGAVPMMGHGRKQGAYLSTTALGDLPSELLEAGV
ncbi:hypothetical protein L210DRAFT_3506823 [Boletus edulis BED1]|uniref:Heterokaryon incompatibility domain-containing protein n=1 Tax=Boletus edulis BED1 TaxID=1328754 RepID=A0AAD4BLA4_BOLED|nr:hypothetical protein L210DRAFT_3506823 [Boletus edulis BED1]